MEEPETLMEITVHKKILVKGKQNEDTCLYHLEMYDINEH